MHFGSPAGTRRLQKAALAAPEVPQDSAKRPEGQPLGDQRASKETPGKPKWGPSSSKGRILEHFGRQNGPSIAFFLQKSFFRKSWFYLSKTIDFQGSAA